MAELRELASQVRRRAGCVLHHRSTSPAPELLVRSLQLPMWEGSQAFVLCFVPEFGDGATRLAANPDATTINIEDPSVSFGHQPRPPGSVGREEVEELLGNNDSDETEVWTKLPVSVL